MKNYDKDKFKKALFRMILALAVLMGIALVENILFWFFKLAINLIK